MTYPAGATYGPRRLLDYEFVWITEGNAEYEHDGETTAAPAGSVILCRKDTVDGFRWDPVRRTRHAFFHFQIHSLPAAWPEPASWPVVRLPHDGDILRPMFEHLLHHGQVGSEFHQRLSIAHLLSAYITTKPDTAAHSNDAWPEAVARAWNYFHHQLEENPAAPIDLAALSKVACVTPEHLCRLFQSTVGFSPLESVRLARLDHAVRLLSRTNYSIAEVARICGFGSPFHFSRSFSAAFGCPPRELRARIRQGEMPPAPRIALSFHAP
ncbi:MAG TPA: AraC family transcriptional regulator [Abditibacteriaceae bacterium]